MTFDFGSVLVFLLLYFLLHLHVKKKKKNPRLRERKGGKKWKQRSGESGLSQQAEKLQLWRLTSKDGKNRDGDS